MPRMGPKEYAHIGRTVLTAAEAADTRLVMQRLAAFTRAHSEYMAAQRQVGIVEGQVRVARLRLAAADAAHGDTIERLAAALVVDGAPRHSPFKNLGVDAPSAIKRLPSADKVAVIRTLVTVAEYRGSLSPRLRQTARAAESAARRIEVALASLTTLQVVLAAKRRRRDMVGATWKKALAALKRGARAAADDGAPRLYATLFGRLQPAATKARRRKALPPTS